MLGLMMDTQLSIPAILEYAGKYHSKSEVVTRQDDGSLHRYTYKDCLGRTSQLAHGLKALGLKVGDRVATLAWNNFRHLELYFAVPGIGCVLHTINPRLFKEQIEFIINDAQDQFVFVDAMFVPLVEAVIARTPSVRAVVVMTDRAKMPATGLKNIICYEDLLHGQPQTKQWPALDERTASGLCYTSGTTGNPKGVLYSHRSTVLHAMTVNVPGVMGFMPTDVFLPVVPMFHVNAWCSPYSAAMAGVKMIMPGPRLDGNSLIELIHGEKITVTAGVPTVWLGLLNAAATQKVSLKPLERVLVGGAACPQAMFDAFAAHGATAIHAWGMTETSPLGSVSTLGSSEANLDPDEAMKLLLKQGRAPFGVEMRITDADGHSLDWDAVARGQLEVRGPWITSGYFNNPDRSSFSNDGWFQTGDVATIDGNGFMQIVDRIKDVIKSGGEWISSIDIENLAMSHPSVAEAAVIAREDAQWGERPRLIVCLKPDTKITGAELLAIIAPGVAKWWIPEDFIIVTELPHSATGKVLKNRLRETYGAQNHPMAQKLG